MARVSAAFWAIVPAGGPVLPTGDNEKFGTFSFYKQLSGKLATCLCVQRTGFGNEAPPVWNNNPASKFWEFATAIYCSAFFRIWPITSIC